MVGQLNNHSKIAQVSPSCSEALRGDLVATPRTKQLETNKYTVRNARKSRESLDKLPWFFETVKSEDKKNAQDSQIQSSKYRQLLSAQQHRDTQRTTRAITTVGRCFLGFLLLPEDVLAKVLEWARHLCDASNHKITRAKTLESPVHLRHQNHHLKTSPVSWVLKSPSTLLSFETKTICRGIMSTSEFATLPLLLFICLEHLRTSKIFSKKCPQRWQKLKSLQSKHLEASIFFWSLDGILDLKFWNINETSTLFLQKFSPKNTLSPFNGGESRI